MAEARAAVAAVLTADVGRHRAHPLHDRRDEHRVWAIEWQAGRSRRHDQPRASRRRSARSTTCATRSAIELAFVDVGPARSRSRSWRPSTTAIDERTRRGRRSSHVLWATGHGAAARRDRGDRPRARCDPHRRRRAERRGDRRSSWRRPAPTCTRSPAQKWLLGPEGMGASRWHPACASGSTGVRRPFHIRDGRLGRASPSWWPDARRFESSNFHRPSIVGHGALDRLAEHVRRARLGVRARHGDGPARGRPAGGDRRRRAPHPARSDGDAGDVPHPRLDGRRPHSRSSAPASSRSPGPCHSSTRCGSASASSRPRRSWIGWSRWSSCWRPTRRRRCRRDGRSRSSARDDRQDTDRADDRPTAVRSGSARGREIRWRQFRNAPRPIVRAVLSSLVGGGRPRDRRTSVYDLALSRGADLPGGDLRVLAVAAYALLVLVVGTRRHVPRRPAADRVRAPSDGAAAGARPSASSRPCRSPGW